MLNWEPAIYEHKAALIGESTFAVSRSAELLAKACLAELARYETCALTVGLDVYNLELEACGAEIRDLGPASCPELARHPFFLDALPESWPPLELPGSGRSALLLEAARQVRAQTELPLRLAATGPLTLAARAVGLTELLLALATEDPAAERLLQWSASVAQRWCAMIRAHGFDVVVFDSMAAPPNLSPSLYRERVKPLHTSLMSQLAMSGQTTRPLIVGGNTTPIAADLAATGATYLVCDFLADAGYFAEALGEVDVIVRRNVSPMLFSRPEVEPTLIRRTAEDLRCFKRPVLGTGILPYAVEPARVCALRDAVMALAGDCASTTGVK